MSALCSVLKKAVSAGFFMLIMVHLSGVSTAGEFRDITGNIGTTSVITCVEGVPGSDILYAGTESSLYLSSDMGRSWKSENISPGNIHVTGIAITARNVFASSEEGLFVKRHSHKNWVHVPGKKGLRGVRAADEANGVFTWTDTELFITDGKSWRLAALTDISETIEDVAVNSGVIYIARGGSLVYSDDGGEIWKKLYMVEDMSLDTDDVDISEIDDDGYIPVIRALRSGISGGVLAATARGIVRFDGATGIDQELSVTGLSREGVEIAIETPYGVMASVSNKVFISNAGAGGWRPVFETAAEGGITDIRMHVDAGGRENIIIATERKIHTTLLEKVTQGDIYREIYGYSRIPHIGPDIVNVQKMAIEYAEVHPDKIKSWRQGAAWNAVLPRLTLAYSEQYDDNLEIYKSASTTYIVDGPRDRRNDWRATMAWDLGDLIWNSSQTLIDVRSRLMVQLRNNILEDLTRLYFERKRLVREARGIADKDPAGLNTRLLRIEELTAYIDAYTGGGFSRAIEQ